MDPYSLGQAPLDALVPNPEHLGTINIWTDRSTKDNGSETCTARAAWVTDTYISDNARLTGITLSNNIAEIAAVILALKAFPGGSLHIRRLQAGYAAGLRQITNIRKRRVAKLPMARHYIPLPPVASPVLAEL